VDGQDVEERPLSRLQGETVIEIGGILEPGVRIQQADGAGQGRDQERDRPEEVRRKR
jgi:hypothetical protein